MTGPPRRGRTLLRAGLVLVVGVAVGIALMLSQPPEEEPAGPVPFSGPVLLLIEDRSDGVEQYGPPTVEVSAGGGTVALEQYATAGRFQTGLTWTETEPLAVTFRPWDLSLEPGFSATLDLAPYVARLRAALDLDTIRRPLLMLVHVEVGTEATRIRISIDGDALLDESVARVDWRAERTAAAEGCSAEVRDLIAATTAGVDDLAALFRTWFGRSEIFPRWVAEVDRGLRLVGPTRSALPADEPRIVELRRAAEWVGQMSDRLDEFEGALRALRSAAVAESSERFLATFSRAERVLMEELVPLRESAEPLVWCAAG